MADLKEQIATIIHPAFVERHSECIECDWAWSKAGLILELPEIKKALAAALLEQGDELTNPYEHNWACGAKRCQADFSEGASCKNCPRMVHLSACRACAFEVGVKAKAAQHTVILAREVAKAKRETAEEIRSSIEKLPDNYRYYQEAVDTILAKYLK